MAKMAPSRVLPPAPPGGRLGNTRVQVPPIFIFCDGAGDRWQCWQKRLFFILFGSFFGKKVCLRSVFVQFLLSFCGCERISLSRGEAKKAIC